MGWEALEGEGCRMNQRAMTYEFKIGFPEGCDMSVRLGSTRGL
jgi:hypothetical protein